MLFLLNFFIGFFLIAAAMFSGLRAWVMTTDSDTATSTPVETQVSLSSCTVKCVDQAEAQGGCADA